MTSWAAPVRGWSLDPPVACALITAALLWAVGARRVRDARGPGTVSRLRSALFLAGLATIGTALQSPIDGYAADRFSVHMAQHLLLTLVAAPLLVLARPVTLLLQASSRETRRRLLLPVLHSRALGAVAAPPVAWCVFALVTWLTHHPSLYELALRNEAVHALEHVAYLGSALLFWFAVAGADPSPGRMGHPARLLYLFLAMPQMTFLGLAISSATHALYPSYGTGAAALADQRLAGTLMGAAGMFVVIPAIAVVLLDWLRREERAADRADARHDRAPHPPPRADIHPTRPL
jgi:putative membrane protein